jgi:hypothetical protein
MGAILSHEILQSLLRAHKNCIFCELHGREEIRIKNTVGMNIARVFIAKDKVLEEVRGIVFLLQRSI